ncbi:MAG: hypothetical protein HQ513_09465 [Rhodospirillales bacterium]|nr:hypothetical protein [Rhodospirillales bacterium]
MAPYGGIRPAPRRRSRLELSLSEREEISRGIVAERSIRSMARLLEGAKDKIVTLGGSHAQRDLFNLVLKAAEGRA